MALAVAISLSSISARAETGASDPAARQVETFCNALLETMKQGQQLGIGGRYKKLKPVIEASFDLTAMTKLVVGPSWETVSASDQKKLVEAFERMTIASYAKNFNSFDGQEFIVQPNVEARNLDRIVQSELKVSDKDPVAFIYRMRQTAGRWKIIDIYLNGTISELALKRSEYAATFNSGGAAALIKKLEELSDTLLNKS